MPLVNADVKSLEVFVACDLSKDPVLHQELITPGNDMHRNNQNDFGLPDRITAKRFVFKLLYGASAFGYANDTDFIDVSTNEKYWQQVIDNFYAKYKGIASWHKRLIQDAQRDRMLSIPSGRYYPIEPVVKYNRIKWPETIIKNYPVQGFGADLVKLARIEAHHRIKRELKETLLISTVHDSLVADAPEHEWEECANILKESVAKVPELCYNIYDYKFSLPLNSEIMVGPNKKEMKEYNAH